MGGLSMKRLLLAAASVLALAAPAAAADMRPITKAPVVPAPIEQVYNWTGFYIGGHVGGAFSGSNTLGNDGKFLGGGQVGFDYQFAPNWVAGIEAQYSWLGGNNNSGGLAFPPAGLVTLDNKGIGSVTGRLGYAFGPLLAYAKGGYAFVERDLNVTNFGAPVPVATSGRSKDGYTVGAGLEYMFAPNWSAKAEYQYYDFGKTTFNAGSPPPLVGTSVRNDEHTVKAGLNYRFTWGGPPAPRY
jgi:outer membrane immunogenic protein